jgi:hypothetical protein
MIFNFQIKNKPALKNKPKIMLSNITRQTVQGPDLEYLHQKEGHLRAGVRKICTHILQSGGFKFKNPVQVIDPDGS